MKSIIHENYSIKRWSEKCILSGNRRLVWSGVRCKRNAIDSVKNGPKPLHHRRQLRSEDQNSSTRRHIRAVRTLTKVLNFTYVYIIETWFQHINKTQDKKTKPTPTETTIEQLQPSQLTSTSSTVTMTIPLPYPDYQTETNTFSN